MFRRLRTIISSTFFSPLFFFLHIDAQYQVSLKSGNKKNILKNQFPIQSNTLQENLINANNLSGIVSWSYLYLFFFNDFFYQPLSQREPNGFTGLVYIYISNHWLTHVNVWYFISKIESWKKAHWCNSKPRFQEISQKCP